MDNKFIEKVKFQEDFAPFEKSEKDWDIEFNWEKEVQNLIKFYLNTTKHIAHPEKWGDNNDYEKNAGRFKINCILGNNGGGKSRLFGSLLLMENNSREIFPTVSTKSLPVDIIFWNDKDSIYVESVINTRKDYLEWKISEEEKVEIEKRGNLVFILDDFFRLSWNIHNSINKEILDETNYNIFFCEVFNFLNSKETNREIFSSFLNIDKDYDFLLNLNVNFRWREKEKYWEEYEIYFLEYEGENFENRKDYINDNLDYELLLKIFILFSDILNEKRSEDTENIYDLFIDKKDYVKSLWLFLSDIFLAMINHLYKNIGNNKGEKIENIIKNREYLDFKRSLELLKEYLGKHGKIRRKKSQKIVLLHYFLL
jgi:hypothetical protein